MSTRRMLAVKSCMALTSLLVSVIFCINAAAGDIKFADFTIDLSENCQSREENGVVTIKHGNSYFFSIGVLTTNAQGAGSEELARQLSQKLGGSSPVLNEYKNHDFSAVQNGIEIKAELISDGKIAIMFLSDKNSADWPDELTVAMESVRGNNPELQEFLEKYFFSDK